jgi:hypothetical protein
MIWISKLSAEKICNYLILSVILVTPAGYNLGQCLETDRIKVTSSNDGLFLLRLT